MCYFGFDQQVERLSHLFTNGKLRIHRMNFVVLIVGVMNEFLH